GKFSVYRVPMFIVSRLVAFQSSCANHSSNHARGCSTFCWRSMENCCTCPSKKLASELPVPVTPLRFVNRVLKVNEPVGEGGCRTSSREIRLSTPNLMVCRPCCQAAVSAISVTSVRNDESVLAGGPSCWNPEIRKVGNSSLNAPFDGIPGMLRLCAGG